MTDTDQKKIAALHAAAVGLARKLAGTQHERQANGIALGLKKLLGGSEAA